MRMGGGWADGHDDAGPNGCGRWPRGEAGGLVEFSWPRTIPEQ